MLVVILLQPLVEVCVKYGNTTEADKYLQRVAPNLKVKSLLMLG